MNENKEIGARIENLIEAKNMSQLDLAKKIGMDKSVLNRIISGDRPARGGELRLLAETLEISVDYLLGRTKFSNIESEFIKINTEELVNIPIVGTIKCGGGQIAYEDISGFSAYPTTDIRSGKEYIALIVKGDSMIGDGINEGDIALIEKETEFVQGKIYAVVLNGEEATLKRVIKADGSIVLQPSNPKYQTRVISGSELEDFIMIGKLVNTKRNYA